MGAEVCGSPQETSKKEKKGKEKKKTEECLSTWVVLGNRELGGKKGCWGMIWRFQSGALATERKEKGRNTYWGGGRGDEKAQPLSCREQREKKGPEMQKKRRPPRRAARRKTGSLGGALGKKEKETLKEALGLVFGAAAAHWRLSEKPRDAGGQWERDQRGPQKKKNFEGG